jgi:glutathione peroxidase
MASFRQKLLRVLYPLIRKAGRSGKNGTVLHNTAQCPPGKPFGELKITLNNGNILEFASLAGKKALIVNTASDCGYTGQYAELQQLHERFGDRLTIIAVPANDFREQEQVGDREIASFCQVNYGVTFPLAQKSVVIKTPAQHPVFQWVTSSAANGWNDHAPDWKFSKYLIDENGVLTAYFGPSISPLSPDLLAAVER